MSNSRLFEILYYLLEHKQTTADTLANYFEVSKRTIYRDIQRLMMMNFPIYCKNGYDGGIYIDNDFVLDRIFFTDDERIEILAALQEFDYLKGENSQLINKMAAIFNLNVIDWIEVDLNSWYQNNDLNKKFNDLKRAIITNHEIVINYINSSGQKSNRVVWPYKLFFKSGTWYLLAYCLNKKENRIFRLSRILKLDIIDKTFACKNIDLSKYKNNLITDTKKEIEVTLQFDHQIASVVYDEFNHSDIIEKQNGDFVVTMKVSNTYWLMSFILSFGSKIKILKPDFLKEQLITEMKKMMEIYQ